MPQVLSYGTNQSYYEKVYCLSNFFSIDFLTTLARLSHSKQPLKEPVCTFKAVSDTVQCFCTSFKNEQPERAANIAVANSNFFILLCVYVLEITRIVPCVYLQYPPVQAGQTSH